MHPRFARLRVTVCDGNPLALYWLPGDQTRTISNAEVVHSWRLSRCPACVLCSGVCTIHYRIQLTAFGVLLTTPGTVNHVVSRGCAPGEMDSVCKH
jgi:hypothetical protein